MNVKHLSALFFLSFFMLAATIPVRAAAPDLSLASKPLFQSNSVKPNVMIMLDNSGSMKEAMYKDIDYNHTTTFYGMFESNKNYKYDITIPVNMDAYNTNNGGAYNVAIVNTSGAFVEDSCLVSADGGSDNECWSGNYLNWLTTRRIDATRQVLVGGKLESKNEYNYGTHNGQQLKYKILANNEYKDDSYNSLINVSRADSADYSPVPNNVAVSVIASPDANGGNQLAAYEPYARLTLPEGTISGTGLIKNSNNNVIGEYGTVMVNDDDNWVQVDLETTFSAPVVVATPATFNGGAPGIIRIKEVSGNSFKIRFQEWDPDGSHVDEYVSYVVMTPGAHDVRDGVNIKKIMAGKLITSSSVHVQRAECTSPTGFDDGAESVSLTAGGFAAAPAVIASVMTNNDDVPVISRLRGVSNTSFSVSLQESEKDGYHNSETIGYIAAEAGSITNEDWSLQAGVVSGVTDNIKNITFAQSFDGTPFFFANLLTYNGADTASLRLNSLSTGSATIHVAEEMLCNDEQGHVDEDVGYIAFNGPVNSFNLALAVTAKNEGLMQDLSAKARLGISFYRYNPDFENIYWGNRINSGTMVFQIPNNPFVKKPSNSALPQAERGYREVTGYIDSSLTDIIDAIRHYPLVWGSTPLAENYWEVIKYFEHEAPDAQYAAELGATYPSWVKATSATDLDKKRDPFYYADPETDLSCAKSTIVIFTDGEPYTDAAVPASVIDFDGDNSGADVSDYANNSNQGIDNLDDVVHYAYCQVAACDTSVDGTRDLRPGVPGNQYLKTHTVAFDGDTIPSILQRTADNGGGNAYMAQDGLSLKSAFEEIIDSIDDSSASSAAVNSGSVTENSIIFQARFDANDWTGELLAYPIDPRDGSIPDEDDAWVATIIPTLRTILTIEDAVDGDESADNDDEKKEGIPFKWDNLSAEQKTLLSDSSDLFDYLRGDQTNEEGSGTSSYRARTSLVGDFVHSSPAFVDKPDFYYDSDLPEVSKYIDFKTDYADRTPMIYVGGNDGMLHAFNAQTNGLSRDNNDALIVDNNGNPQMDYAADFGKEIFAYIPNILISKLPGLSSKTYSHRYFVDGSPSVIDAYLGDTTAAISKENWRTVLVSGLGGGGQGIFALDVTDPAAFATESAGAEKVLWEFTDSNDADLGYTYSQPNIVRLQNGKWAAIFGNGYNNTDNDTASGGQQSNSGDAVLYIVDLADGSLIKKISTDFGTTEGGTGYSNGLSTVSPVDVNADNKIDYVYGGDLHGNLWKFDLNSDDKDDWVLAYGEALFRASYQSCKDSSGDTKELADCDPDSGDILATHYQPVTSPPEVTFHSIKGYMLFFGTGKYLESTDNTGSGQINQTFYGIRDKNEKDGDGNLTLESFDRTDLLKQEISHELSVAFGDVTYELRVTTNYSINNNTHMGWYMDLVDPDDDSNYGERIINSPTLRNERIIFTTLIPANNSCAAGGDGWLMEVNAADGSSLEYSPFDLNDDDKFDSNDFVEITVPGSGGDGGDGGGEVTIKKPVSALKPGGIPSKPIIVGDDGGGGCKEYKFVSTSDGDLKKVIESCQYKEGRQSWKQLGF